MSTPALEAVLASARWRRAAIALVAAAPWLLAAVAMAWRLRGPGIALAVSAAAAATVLVAAAWRMRTLDSRWLVRSLDAHDPRFEDSSALLLEPAERLQPLQRLQRERMRARLGTGARPDLRELWPAHRLLAGGIGAVLVMTVALAWPQASPRANTRLQPGATRAAAVAPITLRNARLRITPPAYTGLAVRNVDALDARVPEASRVHWRLHFAPQPASVALHFHDGRRLAMHRENDAWVAEETIRKAGLYRIVAARSPAPASDAPASPSGSRPGVLDPASPTGPGARAASRAPPPPGPELAAGVVQPDRQYRIDIVADRAPRLHVTRPQQTLTLRSDGRRQWQLAFEGIDDHGVSPRAGLRIITARGSGEAVTFDEANRTLAGSGPARQRRFRHALDIDGFGLGAGDDLIVQFSVADNRPGAAQVARSASYILRWPSREATTASAIDGLVKTVLPAYFRSQRQVIIDAEALLKQKPRLDADTFAARSDAIGVDQRLLRLRYGQFLGEETEGAPTRPLMPTNDAEDEALADVPQTAAVADTGTGTGTPTIAEGHRQDDGHDHGAAADAPVAVAAFGAAGDVLEAFGHTHDHAEAATLLDPATRRTLKSALDAMWQSELQLRQGMPQAALPPANVALALIKQVQQADRIYLARVGYEQVPVDAGRRLGGERKGIAARPRDALVARAATDAAPAALWRALQGPATAEAELLAFDAWLARDGRGVRDPLTLVAATDALRRQPACMRCRERLRALLWPLLSPPPPAPTPRTPGDATGRAYLDALAEPAQ